MKTPLSKQPSTPDIHLAIVLFIICVLIGLSFNASDLIGLLPVGKG